MLSSTLENGRILYFELKVTSANMLSILETKYERAHRVYNPKDYALNNEAGELLFPTVANNRLSTLLMARRVPIDKLTYHFLI